MYVFHDVIVSVTGIVCVSVNGIVSVRVDVIRLVVETGYTRTASTCV